MDVNKIFEYAKKFEKLAQDEPSPTHNYSMSKRYVLDNFFNTFRDKYTILYDTVKTEYDKEVGDLFGPKMTFNFVKNPKNNIPPQKISQDVTSGMENSRLGQYIHAISADPPPSMENKYTCVIQFNNNITEITE